MRSQKEEILRWLLQIGTITPKEAIALCGCYRLSARIADLRAEGWIITTEKPRAKGAKYAVYKLADNQLKAIYKAMNINKEGREVAEI